MENVLSPEELDTLRFDKQRATEIVKHSRQLMSVGTCLDFDGDRISAAKALLNLSDTLVQIAAVCLKGAA